METNMTTGVKRFTTEGRTVAKPSFPVITPGVYEGRIEGSSLQIKKADGQGKIPYINFSAEVLNSATTPGGKNRKVFHRLFLTTTPSPKDGAAMVDRPNQLLALSRATGIPLTLEGDDATVLMEKVDESGNSSEVEVLNPQLVLQWLRQLDGLVFTMKIKTEKGTGGYEDKSVIASFAEAGV